MSCMLYFVQLMAAYFSFTKKTQSSSKINMMHMKHIWQIPVFRFRTGRFWDFCVVMVTHCTDEVTQVNSSMPSMQGGSMGPPKLYIL